MENEGRAFKKRHGKSFKLAYDYGLTASGRKQRIGVYIPSRILPGPSDCPSEQRQVYQVYEFGPGTLCAIMPPKKSRNLVKRFPFLAVHLQADDFWFLKFPADRLDEVAGAMVLRRRRRLSPQQREKAVRNLRRFEKKRVADDG